jgi:transcriptional regulator with PAS, ATPase and Fis domain
MCESEIIIPSDFFFNSKEAQSDEVLENATLDEMEKMTIKKILTKHNGNITLAAKELGLTRTSLYRRIDKYGL